MNSYAKLIETHMISFKEVLVLNYKKIGLNETEAMVIILLYEQKKHNDNALSASSIAKYVTMEEKELSRIIVSLVERGFIELILKNNQECYSLKPTIERLGLVLDLVDGPNYKEQMKLIIGDLEKQFNRKLYASELLIVNRWLTEEYQIELIKNAIDESFKQNRFSIRAIDTILTKQLNQKDNADIDPELEEVLKQINVR